MIIISRRKLIALTLPALTLTKNVSGQTLKSQLGRNETYVALRGNINKSDGIWSYTGSYWGKPDKEIARELFHVDGLSFNSLKLLQCYFFQFNSLTHSIIQESIINKFYSIC